MVVSEFWLSHYTFQFEDVTTHIYSFKDVTTYISIHFISYKFSQGCCPSVFGPMCPTVLCHSRFSQNIFSYAEQPQAVSSWVTAVIHFISCAFLFFCCHLISGQLVYLLCGLLLIASRPVDLTLFCPPLILMFHVLLSHPGVMHIPQILREPFPSPQMRHSGKGEGSNGFLSLLMPSGPKFINKDLNFTSNGVSVFSYLAQIADSPVDRILTFYSLVMLFSFVS